MLVEDTGTQAGNSDPVSEESQEPIRLPPLRPAKGLPLLPALKRSLARQLGAAVVAALVKVASVVFLDALATGVPPRLAKRKRVRGTFIRALSS